MDRTEAKEYIKGQLESYLNGQGINTRKPFRCLSNSHADNKPSMSYKDNRVKCFSCGYSGDIFDLIGIEYGLAEPKDQMDKAFEIYGIDFTTSDLNSVVTPKQQKTEQQPAQSQPKADYTDFFLQANKDLKKCNYLDNRGISKEVQHHFKIGYVEQWRSPKAISNGSNPPASPRIIIPTSKHSYVARDTRAELTETQKKYAKMKEGGSLIFNRKALESQSPIFVVEGEIDALSIIEVGAEALALGSTTNVEAFLKLCKEQPPTNALLIALDKDKAGVDASKKIRMGLGTLKTPFLEVNVNGEYKDPNEHLTNDSVAFKEAIRSILENVTAELETQKETEKEKYLKDNVSNYIQGFINGIGERVNTPYNPTGFKELDRILDGGLYEGLYIMGAISSLGKTTLALQIGDQVAQQGHDVLIFSLEMARNELMAKSISRITFLESGDKPSNAKTTRGITTGKKYAGYNSQEKELIFNSIKSYGTYASNIRISEGMGDIGASQVRETVQKHITFTGNKPVVIIDYLQLLAPADQRSTDKQNTDKAVMELKRMSRDFKIPILAISSLNRENYNAPISMTAFKESGAIEYSSDVLIGLQAKGVGQEGFSIDEAKKKDPREIELKILKNRNGATGGVIEYTYYPLFNYFQEKSEVRQTEANAQPKNKR